MLAFTASLGLIFYRGTMFPERYRGGAFIGQHGSWNRSKFSGYRIAFVPFKDGNPSGPPEDFVTGFIANEERKEVYGRPVGVAMLRDGSLLIEPLVCARRTRLAAGRTVEAFGPGPGRAAIIGRCSRRGDPLASDVLLLCSRSRQHHRSGARAPRPPRPGRGLLRRPRLSDLRPRGPRG